MGAERKNNPAGALRQVQRGAISTSSLDYFAAKVKGRVGRLSVGVSL